MDLCWLPLDFFFHMGPIWDRQDPGGPHVGPMNFAIWVSISNSILFHIITQVFVNDSLFSTFLNFFAIFLSLTKIIHQECSTWCVQISYLAFYWVYFLFLVVSIRRGLVGFCPWLFEDMIRLMSCTSDELEAHTELHRVSPNLKYHLLEREMYTTMGHSNANISIF